MAIGGRIDVVLTDKVGSGRYTVAAILRESLTKEEAEKGKQPGRPPPDKISRKQFSLSKRMNALKSKGTFTEMTLWI